MGLETASPVWKIENLPLAHVSTNENFLTFTKEELGNPEHIGNRIPIVTNLQRKAENDHSTSSMDTVGWGTIKSFDGYTLYLDGEVTEPETGSKLDRKTSDGRRELGGSSMGARMKKQCSICGGNVEEPEHPHERGENYNGQLCTAIANNTKFVHVALTNDFADPESTLDDSKIHKIEVASRIDLNKIKIKKEVAQKMPEGIGYPPANPLAQDTSQLETGPSMEELDMRLKELEKRIGMAKPAEVAETNVGVEDDLPGRIGDKSVPAKTSEESDVDAGNALPTGDAVEQKTGVSQLPTEITIKIDKKVGTEDVTPKEPTVEGSQTEDEKKEKETSQTEEEDKKKEDEISQEEDEEKKVLKEVATKYKRSLLFEVAEKLDLKPNELANKNINDLETMRETANRIEKKGKTMEFASFKDELVFANKTDTGMEEASKRIDQLGVAGALEYAYKSDTRRGGN